MAMVFATGLCSCKTSGLSKDASPIPLVQTVPNRSSGVVEVLNGTGRKGVANLVAERLRRHGFDVVKIGNATERNYSRTLVAERRSIPFVAMNVAKAIGVPSTMSFHNENLLVDVTVFVGRDFEENLP